jgi:hypothetical protein
MSKLFVYIMSERFLCECKMERLSLRAVDAQGSGYLSVIRKLSVRGISGKDFGNNKSAWELDAGRGSELWRRCGAN